MYDIEFYEDIHGKSEVYEYIQKLRQNLNKKNKQKLKKIDIIKCFYEANPKDTKKRN